MIAYDAAPHRETAKCRGLADGTELFEYDSIVVKPALVKFDALQSQLVVVVHALSSDASPQARIDLYLARISAYVVAGALEHALTGIPVALYLQYPGDRVVAVEAEQEATARQIEARCARLQRRARHLSEPVPSVIPGQVLAYVLATRQRT